MATRTLREGTKVFFKIKESLVKTQADPLIDWEGVVGTSSSPGFVTVCFDRENGMPSHKTFAISDLMIAIEDEG